jgi:hypothetical protein
MKIIARLLIMFVVFSTLSCAVSVQSGNLDEDKRTVERAVDQFHKRFNSEQYQDIYNDAHEIYKKSQTQADSLNEFKKTENKFGKMEQVNEQRLKVIIGAPIQIRVVCKAKFDKGEVTETFIFIKDGDTIRLVQYGIYPETVKPEAKQVSEDRIFLKYGREA